MNEKIYTVETLNPRDFDEWVAHCGSIFEVGPDYFRRHFMSDPHRDYNSVFVIKDDEKIVSTVRVFHRQVCLSGKIHKMGGVGEVSTNPSHRKLGLSYKLLEAATEYMKQNDFTLSMLGTGYYSHYEKHGFRQVDSYEKTVDTSVIPANETAKTIQPLTVADYDDMAELYAKNCANLNCCMVRTKEYWELWCAGEIKNPHGLFTDNKLAGYVCFDGDWIAEIVANDELIYDCLLKFVKSDGEVSVPKFVPTSGKIIKEETHSGTMIRVYKPLGIGGGIVLQDTAAAVEYINANGGIVQWSQDSF